MNQEKLAKLQAQVRIGGKVKSHRSTQCFGSLCSFLNVPFVFVSLLHLNFSEPTNVYELIAINS